MTAKWGMRALGLCWIELPPGLGSILLFIVWSLNPIAFPTDATRARQHAFGGNI